jgi:V8-like Glu-specific endopeptidase
MFAEACKEIKESVYGLLGWTRGGTTSVGTAFAIAPGVLATAAHLTYMHAGISDPCQANLEVIQAMEIGSAREKAAVIALDSIRERLHFPAA